MQLELTPEDQAFRNEMRLFFTTKVPQSIRDTVAARHEVTKDQLVEAQRILNDAALGNTAQNHPCRACLVEIEFIDVEAVDKLLVTNPNAQVVRAAIASAVARAIIDDIKAG